ncbi:MAG: hypothetical protein C0411_05525 [Pseudomonas sp.]|nr:hypothetical protein [Pseudomonas sp.]
MQIAPTSLVAPGLAKFGTGEYALWRGSLLPLGCEAAPKPATQLHQANSSDRNGSAAHSSGSKLPRHR